MRAATACDRLPTQPAIYAFFRNIRLPSKESPPEDFLAALNAAVAAQGGPRHEAAKWDRCTWSRLECWSELTETKSDGLNVLAQNQDFRGFLRTIIETASLLQSPLYVGKADKLQDRIRQHLDPMSDLAVRLRETGHHDQRLHAGLRHR